MILKLFPSRTAIHSSLMPGNALPPPKKKSVYYEIIKTPENLNDHNGSKNSLSKIYFKN